MPPKTRDGTSLICPAVSDAALLNMPPPVFGDLLRASNPGLPGIQITSKVVHEAYLLVVASRIMQHPSSFLKAQYREALQRVGLLALSQLSSNHACSGKSTLIGKRSSKFLMTSRT